MFLTISKNNTHGFHLITLSMKKIPQIVYIFHQESITKILKCTKLPPKRLNKKPQVNISLHELPPLFGHSAW